MEKKEPTGTGTAVVLACFFGPKLLDRESAGEDAAVPQSALFFMTPLKAQTTFVSVTWKSLTKFISENFLLRLPHDRSSD